MADHDFEKKTQFFLEWLQNIGVKMSPKMALADFRTQHRGRGAVALQDIQEDEIIFTVPRTSMLDVKNFTTSRGISAPTNLHRVLANMPGWLSLTTAILSERSSGNSAWQPYLDILPQELDSLVFWSRDELKELQASAVVNKIGKAEAETEYDNQVQPLGICDSNVEDFHLVASIIMAYAFDIPEEDSETVDTASDDFVADEEKTTLAMIPLADMLNSDAQLKNARLFCDNEDVLEMRATRAISKGEEILNDYGELPRADLVRRYGYITDNYAAYDVVEISIESIASAFAQGLVRDKQDISLGLSSSELDERLEIARREDVYEDSYDISHPGDEPGIPDELLALLYILLADEPTLVSLIGNDTSLPSRSKLSTSLSGYVLKQLFTMREKEYATTLEHDEQLLKNHATSYSPRMLMALSIRIGEKQVLRKGIEMASQFQGSDKHMRNGMTENRSEADSDRPRKRTRMN